MAWFKREKKRIDQPTPPDERRVKTEGLWTKCESCRAIVWKKDLEANWRVCPKCQHHFRLNATQRLVLLLDSRWVEHDAALARLDEVRLPFISILTDPTTGGVTASYAMLGDINIAEPGALIGFAGPRVIEQTIRQKLPKGFQTAEFLLEHGFLDAVVHRKDLKTYISSALDFFLA